MFIEIRRAAINDVVCLVKARMAFLKEDGEVYDDGEEIELAHAIKNYFEKSILSGDFIAYIASYQEKIIGTSGLVFWARPPYKDNLRGIEAYIMNMYTIPGWRHKGIATNLLNHCIEFCKETNVKRIWLHATQQGTPLYEKAGFTMKKNEMELKLTNGSILAEP